MDKAQKEQFNTTHSTIVTNLQTSNIHVLLTGSNILLTQRLNLSMWKTWTKILQKKSKKFWKELICLFSLHYLKMSFALKPALPQHNLRG
jgi:hypothetical protein